MQRATVDLPEPDDRKVAARLDQDAAELGAVDHEVVGPFQGGLRDTKGAQRPRCADAGDKR